MTRSALPLSPSQLGLWRAFKRAHELVLSRIEGELQERADLSGPELGVLSRLVELGAGQLRQQRLADSMHWEKSRLSHQLSRMAARGLVTRKRDSAKFVTVVITRSGQRMLAAARLVHAEAIRTHLLEAIPARDHARLARVYRALAGTAADDE